MFPGQLYGKHRRSQLQGAGIDQAEQSKMIGKEWKQMPDGAKAPWRRQALVEAREHKTDHPDYKYKPNTAKAKSSKPRPRPPRCRSSSARKQRRRPTSAANGVYMGAGAAAAQPGATSPPTPSSTARKRKGGKSRGGSGCGQRGAATKRKCAAGACRDSVPAMHGPASMPGVGGWHSGTAQVHSARTRRSTPGPFLPLEELVAQVAASVHAEPAPHDTRPRQRTRGQQTHGQEQGPRGFGRAGIPAHPSEATLAEQLSELLAPSVGGCNVFGAAQSFLAPDGAGQGASAQALVAPGLGQPTARIQKVSSLLKDMCLQGAPGPEPPASDGLSAVHCVPVPRPLHAHEHAHAHAHVHGRHAFGNLRIEMVSGETTVDELEPTLGVGVLGGPDGPESSLPSLMLHDYGFGHINRRDCVHLLDFLAKY